MSPDNIYLWASRGLRAAIEVPLVESYALSSHDTHESEAMIYLSVVCGTLKGV